MRKLRDNQGFTLIELIVAIAIGTLVTAAATALLLMGLRIYTRTTQKGLRQNEVRLAITVMENLISEAPGVQVDENEAIRCTDGLVVECVNGAIVTGAGAQILDEVTSFDASNVAGLVTVQFVTDGETYTFCVYTRVAQTQSVAYTRRSQSPQEILTTSIHDEALAPGVRAFLKVLESQLGSDGRILTEAGAGEYYSSWYIGGYENNPDWSQETPWCVCFISWALEECDGYIQGETLKFANVDKLWAEFVTSDTWKDSDPNPGDIIIFDWIVDDETNPEHTGIVFAVEGEWVYTIEGNSDNSVKICKYLLENPCILGYGSINWT